MGGNGRSPGIGKRRIPGCIQEKGGRHSSVSERKSPFIARGDVRILNPLGASGGDGLKSSRTLISGGGADDVVGVSKPL